MAGGRTRTMVLSFTSKPKYAKQLAFGKSITSLWAILGFGPLFRVSRYNTIMELSLKNHITHVLLSSDAIMAVYLHLYLHPLEYFRGPGLKNEASPLRPPYSPGGHHEGRAMDYSIVWYITTRYGIVCYHNIVWNSLVWYCCYHICL